MEVILKATKTRIFYMKAITEYVNDGERNKNRNGDFFERGI